MIRTTAIACVLLCALPARAADGVTLELRAGAGVTMRAPSTAPPPPGHSEPRPAAAAGVAAAVELSARDDLRFGFALDYTSSIAGTMSETVVRQPERTVRVRTQTLAAQVITRGRVLLRPRGALWLGAGPAWAFEPFSSPVHPATPTYAIHRVGIDVPLIAVLARGVLELGAAPTIALAISDGRGRGHGLDRIGWALGGQASLRVRITARLGAFAQWRGRWVALGGARLDALHTGLVGLSLRASFPG